MNCLAPITVARLHERLSYDPATGILTWKACSNPRLEGCAAGSMSRRGYMKLSCDGRFMSAHRVAWALFHGTWPELGIDHINRNKSDNRICNLRLATPTQNNANRGTSRNNSHGAKGVTRLPSGSWQAQIQVQGKNHYLGAFRDKMAAKAAYAAAAQRFFGDFASTGVLP